MFQGIRNFLARSYHRWRNPCKRWGIIVLGYGRHEIVMKTNCEPKRIFLSLEEPEDCVPVCGGKVSMAGAKALPNGFVLYADVNCDLCVIEWFAQY